MATRLATKELLINSIGDVFVSKGYDGATLAHLAHATGLSKASLYHHFPGGKTEMAQVLIRHTIARLHGEAFSYLTLQLDPIERLSLFIDGFADYVHQGRSDCLLAVFNHHGTASEEAISDLQEIIASQFADWHNILSAVYVAAGRKNKRSRREAHDLIAALYGALLNAKIHNAPQLFVESVARLKKRIQK